MHINLATKAAGQVGQNEMLKKYLLFVKKKLETIEICPHPPPTALTPSQARQNAVEKQKNEGDSSQRSKGYKFILKFSSINAKNKN